MRTLIIALVLSATALGCGGRLASDETETDSAVDAAKLAPPTRDGGVTVADAGGSGSDTTPTSDASPPADVAPPPVDAGGSICSGMAVTGSPSGSCMAEVACPASASMAAARDLLACVVDKCLAEHGAPKWCGTIMLGIDGAGCTNNYIESPSAGGCVKYQGMYRRWNCAKDQKITVTRPCE